MWIYKPNCCEEESINSIDIDPSSERVAIASDRIAIWVFESLVNESSEHSILAELENHIGQVNSVRWCPSGQYLSSAGDDYTIIIWHLSTIPSLTNKENWTPAFFLYSHSSEVTELVWNNKGTLLASGSIDGVVHIWNIDQKLKSPVSTLIKHNTPISGLVFDPMDKHLLTFGEDRVLVKWCTHNWKPLKFLSINLDHGNEQSFRKIDISCDGEFIVAPGQRKSEDIYSANLITAGAWETDKQCLGHAAPISVGSFSPTMYSNSEGVFTLLAIGGYDCALSIWNLCESAPYVIKDLFNKFISDIKWTRDGRNIIVASEDGDIAILHIGEFLGKPMEQEEYDRYMLGKYKELPEHPINIKNPIHKDLRNSELFALNQQIETRLYSGKKRIQPMVLGVQEAINLDKQPRLSISIRDVSQDKYTEGICSWQSLNAKNFVCFSIEMVVDCVDVDSSYFKTYVKLRLGTSTLWETYLYKRVEKIEKHAEFLIFFTENSLFVFDLNGNQTLPELSLPYIDKFFVENYIMLLVTSSSMLELWDLHNKTQLLSNSIQDLGECAAMTLRDSTVPYIETVDGNGFIFDFDLQLWLNVKTLNSFSWNGMDLDVNLIEYDDASIQLMELAHIENEMVRLERLGQEDEYKYLFIKYVQILADSNNKLKLFDLRIHVNKTNSFLAGYIDKVLEQHSIELIPI